MPVTGKQAVLLFGPPGSGKGTQGRALGDLPDLVHYDMGENLRRIPEDSDLGRRIQSEISGGRLLPPEIVMEAFDRDLQALEEDAEYRPEEHVLVLDGLPRNSRQAEALTTRVDLLGAIDLVVDDPTELFERLRRRGLANGRVDDVSQAVVEERVERFHRESRPLLDLFEPECVMAVDASNGPLEVLESVVGALLRILRAKRPPMRPAPDSMEPKGAAWRSLP